MNGKRIILCDEEEDRLGASEHILRKSFPDATVEAHQWELLRAKPRIDAVMERLLQERSERILLMTNIIGMESGMLPAIASRRDPRLTLILNSCNSQQDIEKEHAVNLDGLSIHYIRTFFNPWATKIDPNSMPYGQRLRALLASLPKENPFHLQPVGQSIAA